MPDAFLQPVLQMGVAGFSILVMWWMYRHSSDRMDKKDEAFRLLSEEVRKEIMSQLNKNSAVLENVINHLAKHTQ